MKAARYEDLPLTRVCNSCGVEKPRREMIVQHRPQEGFYYFRPKCKRCYNERERGHRREYKRKYLQRWRRENLALNQSYWKGNPVVKEQARVNAYRRFKKDHAAILIQGRMNRRGQQITIEEARELLAKFGPCYPSRFGLTKAGLRECERIRARLRARNGGKLPRHITPFDIRLMVYEEALETPSLMVPPHLQDPPYRRASEHLTRYHRNRRILEGERGSANV